MVSTETSEPIHDSNEDCDSHAPEAARESFHSAPYEHGARPAYLIWTDVESGEELGLELHASPEFVIDLVGQGFAPALEPRSGPETSRCTLVIRAERRSHDA